MTTAVDSARLHAAFAGLGPLKAAAREGRPEAAAAAAREFEALMIRMLLSSMRATGPGDPLFGSEALDTYRDLLDGELARSLAARDSFGIGALVRRELAAERPVPVSPRVASPGASAARAPSSAAPAPERFVAELTPHARVAAERLGTVPEVLIAQAALETGWGERVMRRADGASSFNVFGIKAGSSWDGERVRVPTLEYDGTVARREWAEFRAYDSLAAAFADYVQLVESDPRYAEARAQGADPSAYIRALADAGYATDPRYAEKVLDVMRRVQPPATVLAEAAR